MIVAAALAGVTVLIAAGVAWTARLVHIGNLDAHDLADKLSVPAPVSALDWPELHLNAVVAQPDEQPVVLLHLDWPAPASPASGSACPNAAFSMIILDHATKSSRAASTNKAC